MDELAKRKSAEQVQTKLKDVAKHPAKRLQVPYKKECDKHPYESLILAQDERWRRA